MSHSSLHQPLWPLALSAGTEACNALRSAIAHTDAVCERASRANIAAARLDIEQIALLSPYLLTMYVDYMRQLSLSSNATSTARSALCLLFSDLLHYLMPHSRDLAQQTLTAGLGLLLLAQDNAMTCGLVDIWHRRDLIDDASRDYMKRQINQNVQRVIETHSGIDNQNSSAIGSAISHVAGTSKSHVDGSVTAQVAGSIPYFEQSVGNMVAIMNDKQWQTNRYHPIDPQMMQSSQTPVTDAERGRLAPVLARLAHIELQYDDDDMAEVDYEGWDQATWRTRSLKDALADVSDDDTATATEHEHVHGAMIAPPKTLT